MLSQKVHLFMCPLARHVSLVEQKEFYKLTRPRSEPSQTNSLLEAVPFPLLNQPPLNVVLRSILLPDLDEQGWVIRYLGMNQRNAGLVVKTMESGNGQPFTKYSDYAQLLESYRAEQSKSLISFQVPGLVSIFFSGVAKVGKAGLGCPYPNDLKDCPCRKLKSGQIWGVYQIVYTICSLLYLEC